MSNISSIVSAYQNAVTQTAQITKNQTTKTPTTNQTASEIEKSTVTEGTKAAKSPVAGRTIGNPKLSEKASKYYEQLKKKFGNMDFILVSKDQKEAAQAQASNYANPNRPVVLIDEEKIERMAEDEKFRKQYEGIISGASSQLAQMAGSFASSGANVKAYGMKVNDNGTTSFFAVIDKSLAAQKERIQKHAQEKKEAQRAENRKASQEDWKDRINSSHQNDSDEDNVTITASSIDELLQKIDDMMFSDRSNMVQTEEEKLIGQNINFSV